jgi:hypothetical protein
MPTEKRPFTLRIIKDNYEKLQIISEHEHRSMAAQIEYLIQECIAKYETEHGMVPLSPDAIK